MRTVKFLALALAIGSSTAWPDSDRASFRGLYKELVEIDTSLRQAVAPRLPRPWQNG